MSLPTIERLRHLLDYDAETGVLLWKNRTGKLRRLNGTRAGSVNDNGYRIVCVDRQDVRAHRAVWAMMTGKWPADDIDHINRQRDDNRFCNLREATRTQNHANRVRQCNNSLGYKGVHLHKQTGKYRAQIRINGRRVHIGLFSTPEAAHGAYVDAAHRLFGEFAFDGVSPKGRLS